MTETHSRTIARAVSYRIVATLITALIVGLESAVYIHVILTLLHYVMERLWLRVRWGRVSK